MTNMTTRAIVFWSTLVGLTFLIVEPIYDRNPHFGVPMVVLGLIIQISVVFLVRRRNRGVIDVPLDGIWWYGLMFGAVLYSLPLGSMLVELVRTYI